MISKQEIDKARQNFELASKDFGFIFHSPFSLTETIASFGYIENYGSKNGTIICLTAPPDFQADKAVMDWCKQNDFFYSFINIQPLLDEYNASYFREMLCDWGRY